MTRRFAVKKEIRSLGVDLCNPSRVIGAVARGGLYLDGVVTFVPERRRWSMSIADDIVRIRFYPELKLIMTHDPWKKLDNLQIEKSTNLPVIQVRTVGRPRSKGWETFKVGTRELYVRSRLNNRIVQEVLAATWTSGLLPEPLRVAHLIARSRFQEKKG